LARDCPLWSPYLFTSFLKVIELVLGHRYEVVRVTSQGAVRKLAAQKFSEDTGNKKRSWFKAQIRSVQVQEQRTEKVQKRVFRRV
jgi:hypothetical protein